MVSIYFNEDMQLVIYFKLKVSQLSSKLTEKNQLYRNFPRREFKWRTENYSYKLKKLEYNCQLRSPGPSLVCK